MKGSPMRGLLIVARDQMALYDYLQSAYGDSAELMLILDRRQGDRRRADRPVHDERRRRERRSPPEPNEDLRSQPFVIARPYDRRPRE
jgi:hypothetical protein